MDDIQAEAFSSGEGDSYFGRNRNSATSYDVSTDTLVRLVEMANIRPESLIEVGAASGHRVASLIDRWGCRGVALEPSIAAVEEGRRQYPDVEFVIGSMDKFRIDGVFDLVLVNFVFHWVGRSLLLQSIASLDRLVADQGHLAIADFLPAGLTKTPYKHREGLWTYKQDYGEVFVSSGLYCRIATLSGQYGGQVPCGDAEPSYRSFYSLLHKSHDGHYQPVTMQ